MAEDHSSVLSSSHAMMANVLIPGMEIEADESTDATELM